MRRVLLSSVAVTALVLGTECARADDLGLAERHWYATLFAGIGSPERAGITHDSAIYNTDLKTGFTIGGAIGTELAPGLRGELEFSYQRYAARDFTFVGGQPVVGSADGPANVYLLTANLWRDLEVGLGFTPYFGGGLGLGVADVDIAFFSNAPDLDDAGIGLAAQLGAGLRFPLSGAMSVDLSYRFKALVGTTILGDKSNADDHGKMSLYSHVLQAGLVYDFGGPKSGDVPGFGDGGAADWYVSLFGGATLPESTGLDVSSLVGDFDMKTGFTVGGAVGTRITDTLRGELEVSYLNYAGKDYTVRRGQPPSPVSGDTDLYFVLANLWTDLGRGNVLVPYVGGGLGIGLVSSNLLGAFEKSDTEIGLAGQFGIGLRYMTGTPWTIDAGYRFKGIVDVTLDGNDAVVFAHTKGSFYSHNLQIGATYAFGAVDRVEPASADPSAGDWYVSLFGGGVVPSDSGFTNVYYVDNVDFDAGFTVGIAVGTEVAPGLRGELEASYMRNTAEDYTRFRTQPPVPASGDANLYFILANLWKDFDLGNGFAPYIGGGIGIGIADVDVFAGVPLDDTAVGLAGQLGAGLRFKITENLTADAGYRFKGLLDATVRGDPNFFAPHAKMSFFSHSFIGGITYGF